MSRQASSVATGATALEAGNLVFNGDGTLDANDAGTTLGTFNATTGELISTVVVTWTNGASPSSIAMDWGTNNLTDGLTQFASGYNVAFINQNGAAVGLLSGVTINDQGIVTASFTNGESQALYKLPISTFADPSSLKPVEGNAYLETNESGDFNLRAAGSGGAGKFAPSALEASNVDIAQEFTNMIITQRAYSANTRVITTADEMLEELIRLKR